MKTLSAKHLDTNKYILNKINSHPQAIFTTDDLVKLRIFSSNGWASMRRKRKLLPKYAQYGPRIVTYKKEDVLDIDLPCF